MLIVISDGKALVRLSKSRNLIKLSRFSKEEKYPQDVLNLSTKISTDYFIKHKIQERKWNK